MTSLQCGVDITFATSALRLKISLSIDGVADDGKAIVHAEVRSAMPR